MKPEPNPHPIQREEPLDMVGAIGLARRAAEYQRDGEKAVRDASKKLAEAERSYRVELAKAIVAQHAAGTAWTLAKDLARGEDRIANLRYARDVAKGVFDAASQRAWRHTADRKDVLEFIAWCKAREFAEARGEVREPDNVVTFGARS